MRGCVGKEGKERDRREGKEVVEKERRELKGGEGGIGWGRKGNRREGINKGKEEAGVCYLS